MRLAPLPFLCLALVTSLGCNLNAVHGSGIAKTESRAVASFSKIELSGSPDVEVTVGPATSLTVTSDDNILPLIETTVSGDTLSIHSKQSYISLHGVNLKITVPEFTGLSVSGSGDIRVQGLTGGDLDASITGSGDVTLKGTTDRLRAKIVGSGDLRAGDLAAKDVRVTITGSGNATVRAAEQLDASVTGSGDVHYYGNPPQVRKNITGSGDISPR
jgi:hypothetical protein